MAAHYKTFIAWQNMLSEMLNETKLPNDIRELTSEDVNRIKSTLENLLSPETLHSDGEATEEEVKGKLEHYRMIYREISENTKHKIDFSDLNY